jgi:hypothetical protein
MIAWIVSPRVAVFFASTCEMVRADSIEGGTFDEKLKIMASQLIVH